ncbi:MAG: hypothetical protein H6601_10000 [Flavobacteriales bacterium]|nr:hypothetical protein [Flavobacteriales bacterium]
MAIRPYNTETAYIWLMYHLEGTVLTLAFMAFFIFLIPRMSFFRIGTIPVRWFQGVFVLKVLSGFLLYLIYTYYYTDRSTADIWKYYDDGMVMFSALREHPADYLKMLFGIANDGPEFTAYYDRMNHWYRPYGTSIANDTHTIIRFNAFMHLFSLGHYNVHSVVVNFLGLVGLTGILHFLKQMAPSKEKWFFAAVFLMPGMMFWASGVLKEPILLFGLGLFLYGLMKWMNEGFSIARAAVVVLSLALLTTVKSYALAAIGLGIIAWMFSRKWPNQKPVWFFLGVFAVGFIGLMLIHQTVPEKSVFSRIAQQQHEFYQLAEGGTYLKTPAGDSLYVSAADYEKLQFVDERRGVALLESVEAVNWRDAKKEGVSKFQLPAGEIYEVLLDYGKTGSTIEIPRLEPNAWSILKVSPIALMNALFRPLPWKIRSPFMLLSGIENIIVILLLLAMVSYFDRTALSNPVFWVAVSFSLSILVLTGLVTPVVGAIVRYKVPALPFLACALLALTDTASAEQFLLRKLPFLKRYF